MRRPPVIPWASLAVAAGLFFGSQIIAYSQAAAMPERPQLVVQGHFLKGEISLLVAPAGAPHILWRDEVEAGSSDQFVHVAKRSLNNWQELFSSTLLTGGAPVGVYDEEGTLYLATQNIRPWRTLSIYTFYTFSGAATTPTEAALFKWKEYIYPKFLAAPAARHPIHVIFESQEGRFTWWSLLGWVSGHVRSWYGRYYSTQWDGQHWTKPVQMVDRGNFHVLDMACASGQPPYVACVWTDSRHGWNNDALFFSDYDGMTWSKNVALGEGRRASLGMELAIAVGPDGRITVAFEPTNVKSPKGDQFESGGILVQERRAGAWGPVRQLTVSVHGSPPALSVDPQGRTHLVWPEQRGILHRMRLGDEWTPPRVLVPRYAHSVTPLRFSADGQAHLAWMTMTDQPDPKNGRRQDQIWYQALRFE